MTTSQRPVSLWRNRDYLLLWSGQIVSNIGDEVSFIAFPLLILLVTGSPAQAGFVSALRVFTYVILVLPAGAIVDRWDRKRMMIVCDTVRALCLASIPVALVLGHLTLVQLYISAFLEEVFGTFFNIAEVSSLPQVVAKEQLTEATGRVQASTGIANLFGPPLGGFLFALRSYLPFLTDAVSYVVSVLSLLLIHTSFQEQHSRATRQLREEIAEGIRWLWQQPLIRFLALFAGILNFSQAGLTLIVILIAQSHHASDATIGLIFGMSGIGGILGSLLAGMIQKRLSIAQILIGDVVLVTILWLAMAPLPSVPLLALIVAAQFFLGPIFNTVVISYRLALTPDPLRGRVNSVARLIANGISPLGLALSGISLQYLGLQMTIFISVGIQVLLVFATLLNRALHQARPLSEVQEKGVV